MLSTIGGGPEGVRSPRPWGTERASKTAKRYTLYCGRITAGKEAAGYVYVRVFYVIKKYVQVSLGLAL